jgi:hypothetical protein
MTQIHIPSTLAFADLERLDSPCTQKKIHIHVFTKRLFIDGERETQIKSS